MDHYKNLYIGLMSGTSMDGIDAAVMDCTTNTFIEGLTLPYSDKARQYLNAVLNEELTGLKNYSQLNTLIGREFGYAAIELLKKANLSSSSIQAIGSHGQTLCHDASAEIPYSVQLGCAHTIAELTGIKVVADFRTRDLVVGGQGAPFAPIYHQVLFQGQGYPLAVVNIGGIANMTYLEDNLVSGYDLGPGNCLMDAWIKKNFGKDYDENGLWAASGKLIPPLLDKLLTDAYFQRKKPKSIGKEYFSLTWLSQYLNKEYQPVDVQATLLMLTAATIAEGIKLENKKLSKVFICGGGANNYQLINKLSEILPEIKVQTTESIHINPNFIEAQMFAWLADKALKGTALNLNQITGSKKPSILGVIYPK